MCEVEKTPLKRNLVKHWYSWLSRYNKQTHEKSIVYS